MILAILAAILVGAVAVFLVLGLGRTANQSTHMEQFAKDIKNITVSELDSDKKEEIKIESGSWNGFWLKKAINTGRIPKTLEQPGRQAIIYALVTFGVGFLIWPRDVFGGLLFSVLALFALNLYYNFEAKRRTKTLEKQLTLMLSSLSANLRANQTPQSSLIAIADDIPSPLGDELKLVKSDLELNVPLNNALDKMAERVPSREIKFLVAAIEIAIDSGADLEPQLVIIQEIVDNRTRIQQRLSSALASVQPALLVSGIIIPAGLIFSFYSDPANKAFWLSFYGLVAAGVVGFLYALGLFISKKLVDGVEKV